MAITKERKDELVSQYVSWVGESQAMVLTKYLGLTMKQIDDLRAKIRDAGGEFHIVKNTLGKVAFEEAGLPLPQEYFEGSTAVAFAFKDVPALAKILSDFARTNDAVEIKGGYLAKAAISANDVRALADLPPLPVLRAQLLGVINAPASKLARTLAEPGRQVAAVLQAFVEKDAAAASA